MPELQRPYREIASTRMRPFYFGYLDFRIRRGKPSSPVALGPGIWVGVDGARTRGVRGGANRTNRSGRIGPKRGGQCGMERGRRRTAVTVRAADSGRRSLFSPMEPVLFVARGLGTAPATSAECRPSRSSASARWAAVGPPRTTLLLSVVPLLRPTANRSLPLLCFLAFLFPPQSRSTTDSPLRGNMSSIGNLALITGATGGIGRSIAETLGEQGHDLVLVARSATRLRDTAAALRERFAERDIRTEVCDVACSSAVKVLFERLKTEGVTLDVLVNGAGISGGGITAEVTDETWLNVINTNLNGTFFVTREILRLGLMPNGGRIINIASTGGKQGVIHGAPYCASKHGMVGFTKALGLELARNKSGITVNAVCPGFVETEMAERVREHYSKIWGTDPTETKRRVEDRVPLGRYIDPSEVAGMVSYFVSPRASGVTAQAFNVCGGLGNY